MILGFCLMICFSEEHTFGLDDFHLWFKTVVLRWFDIAQAKAKQRIKKAIAVDKVRLL